MSANVTLLQLRTKARQLSATENNPNISDAELTAYANTHVFELWDRLVDAGPADYYASDTAPASTSPAVASYALPDDFRNLVAVHLVRDGVKVRKIDAMPEGAVANYKPPTAVQSFVLEYIPVAPTLEDDADTIDGVSGWGELIANLMARDVMTKRESNPSVVMSNIARLEARITARSRARDRGPKRTVDTDEIHRRDAPWWARIDCSTTLACYRLRAGNIELYESAVSYP